jgi:hypothetical protein
MTARRLLTLYPRAWRARYGDEFLETVGDGDLRLQQIIDIISSAVDAWLSADVRHATRPASAAMTERGTMTVRTLVCSASGARYTRRDGLIGAGVMIASAIVFAVSGTVLRQAGWTETGEAVLNLGYLGSMTISMPFWLMKGQPWKAQLVIVGGTLTMLIAIGVLSQAVN